MRETFPEAGKNATVAQAHFKARLLHRQTRPLLSSRDIWALLNPFLPRRDTILEEVLRHMEVRHRKR